MVLEVRLHFLDEVGVVRARGIQPEDGRRLARSGALRLTHPVLDRRVLGLAHAPDVALLDVVFHEDLRAVTRRRRRGGVASRRWRMGCRGTLADAIDATVSVAFYAIDATTEDAGNTPRPCPEQRPE